MRALGIETATSIASVAIVVEEHLVAEAVLPQRGNHARTLLPLIDQVLAAAGLGLRDLDALAVSIGPGSFTGLRVGLSVAKGLVLATGIPLVTVPTLTAYAYAVGVRPGLVCPMLDARRGEVYAAGFRYRGDEPECVTAPMVVAPERFAASVREPCTLVGDGVDAYADLWRRALGTAATLIRLAELPPSAAVVARLGARRPPLPPDQIADLEPNYCRPSDAEVKRAQRVADAQVDASGAGVWKN